MAYARIQEWTRPATESQPFWYRAALGAVTILALLLRVLGVGTYPKLIYDEYYYVPAADVLLHRHPPTLIKNMVPGIDPNLLSHPPLAKELIALSIYLLGNHPWVWRLPGVVLGSVAPLIVGLIAFELFNNWAVSVGAASLAAADGLLITMSRVALPDSPAVPLVLIGVWLMLTILRRLRRGQPVSWARWSGFAAVMGLALAAEWIGGQALVLAACWLAAVPESRRDWKRWLPVLVVIPFAIYYASYFYAWPSGYHQPWLPRNPFWAFFPLQVMIFTDMWHLTFFHPWTANAWTWLGIPRPTALLLTVSSHQTIRMMAFSDPWVVWMGLASMAGGLLLLRRQPVGQRRAWVFLLWWLLCFYGTWLLTPRSKFLYYFTTASAGLDVAAAAGLVLAWRAAARLPWRLWAQTGLVVLDVLSVLSIAYLLPLWVGIAMPRPFYHAIWWPSQWNPRVQSHQVPTTQSFSLTLHPTRQAVGSWTGVPQAAAQAPVPSPWAVLRGQDSHNSVYAASWRVKTGYALKLGTALAEAPAVAGSIVYQETMSDQLYAVNVPTGTVLWSVGLPNMAMGTPVVEGQIVVVGLGNSVFQRFTRSHGWIRGTGASGLMALNAATGHELWWYHTGGESMATPAIQRNTVYDVTGAGRLVAVNLNTGQEQWSLRLAGFDSTSSPVIVGHHLYVATNAYFSSYPAKRSTVWSVNLLTHRVAWSRNLPVKSGLSDCSLAVGGHNLYIAGVPAITNGGRGPGLSNRLFAVNRYTGHVGWSQPLGAGRLQALSDVEEGIPLAVGNRVYIGSPASDRVFAFDGSNGQKLWSRRVGAGVTANPVLWGSNLLVAGMNGQLDLLNANTGRLVGRDPVLMGPIGAASPLIVGGTLIQATMGGQLMVQPWVH